ncbi:MAG: hypothetical protein AAFX85_02415, partial [Pseudomonadota bacterium]
MKLKLRNAIGTALAIGVLGTSAAQADVTYGEATRSDRSTVGAIELMNLLTPSVQRDDAIVPNRLNTPLPQRPDVDLPADPLVADGESGLSSPTPGADFLGVTSDDNSEVLGFRVQPPDTNGDTGLTEVVMYINLTWRVFDKMGNPLSPAMPGNTFWAGFGGPCEFNNNGDPVVLYDEEVGRWVFNQFSPNEGIQCFAISDGEDPLGPYT